MVPVIDNYDSFTHNLVQSLARCGRSGKELDSIAILVLRFGLLNIILSSKNATKYTK